MASARTGVVCVCMCVFACLCTHAFLLASEIILVKEAFSFSVCVNMRAYTSRREAVNLLWIFVCEIVLVKEGVFVYVHAYSPLVYVLCVQPPSQLWRWCVPPQVLFQSADCHPKMLFSWVLFKTIVTGAPGSFYKGPLPRWGLTCYLLSADQRRGVWYVCVMVGLGCPLDEQATFSFVCLSFCQKGSNKDIQPLNRLSLNQCRPVNLKWQPGTRQDIFRRGYMRETWQQDR